MTTNYKLPYSVVQQRKTQQEAFWNKLRDVCSNGGGIVEKDGIAVVDLKRYKVELK